jgi:signal transduction histidine kinase
LVVIMNYALIYSIPGSLFVVFGFLASGVLLFIGAFSFELFSMVPFALERVMGTMQDAVVILDDKGRVLFLNPAAECLIGGGDASHGKEIGDVMPGLPVELLAMDEPGTLKDEVREVLPRRYFDVHTIPILDHGDHIIGRTVTLHEVTAQRTAEDEARRAHEKLELMNNITRHDVLSQLTVLEGHLVLADMKAGPGAVGDHLAASSRAARAIQKQMRFAKDYQEMGVQLPQWHDVEGVFRNLAVGMVLKDIALEVEAGGVDVYADPMLERVFYNLLDNSMTHGQKVSVIRITVAEKGGRLDIIYTDDGVGILSERKPTLFTKGSGRNAGLGLFLSREILAHSGLTISEDGVPGMGVRFVIGVPAGKYRFLKKAASTGESRCDGGQAGAAGKP